MKPSGPPGMVVFRVAEVMSKVPVPSEEKAGLDPRRSHRQGACAILLGEEPGAVVRDLEDRFPEARLRVWDARLSRIVAGVVEFVEMPTTGLDPPPDVRGSAFGTGWQAIRMIL
jgi:hypothetical protein